MSRKPSFLPLLVLALATSAGGEDHGPREVGALEGIWKMCYAPGLERVDEIDSGYLVLMPGGRYYEVTASCCALEEDPEPPYWELGDYEREADGTVLLHGRRHDGTPLTIRLRHRPAVRAVFFDDPRGAPVQAEALTAGRSIDYGFCRAYPGPEGFPRSPPAPAPSEQ